MNSPAGQPQAARALLTAPWGLRFSAAGGAGVQVILRGTAWLLPPDGGDPIHMAAGDVALIRRRRPHGMADDPSTPLYDVTIDEHDPEAHWPADGSAMDDGAPGTVLLGGSYYLNGVRPHPLFASLPEVIHLPARIGAAAPVRTVVDLLGAEMDSERPGVSAAVPALLDLLFSKAFKRELGLAPAHYRRRQRTTAEGSVGDSGEAGGLLR